MVADVGQPHRALETGAVAGGNIDGELGNGTTCRPSMTEAANRVRLLRSSFSGPSWATSSGVGWSSVMPGGTQRRTGNSPIRSSTYESSRISPASSSARCTQQGAVYPGISATLRSPKAVCTRSGFTGSQMTVVRPVRSVTTRRYSIRLSAGRGSDSDHPVGVRRNRRRPSIASSQSSDAREPTVRVVEAEDHGVLGYRRGSPTRRGYRSSTPHRAQEADMCPISGKLLRKRAIGATIFTCTTQIWSSGWLPARVSARPTPLGWWRT